MESLSIRPIQISDCYQIFKLIKEYAHQVGESCNLKIQAYDLEQLGFNDADKAISFYGLIAHLDAKEAIGIALYHKKYSTWDGNVMHLNTFFVSEKYRGQGVGTRMFKQLAKIAQTSNYARISFEIQSGNEPAKSFFMKFGAFNLTKDEDWLNYEMELTSVKNLIGTGIVNNCNEDGIIIRSTEVKDCAKIKGLIQELAEFEKMPDGPKLTVKDLQRDGFYSLYPSYYSFVAGLDKETEVIGYAILFLTFHPIKGKMVHLEDIYVTPKHRGKGIGERLLKQVAKFVDDGTYNGLTLEVLGWNTKAIQFYEKFGAKNLSLESFRFRKESILQLAN